MSCPTKDHLERLAYGTLHTENADEIERHLLECETCCNALSEIERTQNDPIAQKLRIAANLSDNFDIEKNSDDNMIAGYRIKNKIGVGGMGTVYEAVEENTGNLRAIKVLHSTRHFDRVALLRFRQEKETIIRLKHLNIVEAFASEDSDRNGRHYIVMERLHGIDLAAHVKQNGPLTMDHAKDVIVQVCCGLHYAHQNNIVHRDIKPSNLFLTDLNTVKILDLGTARLTESDNNPINTFTNQIIGTPDFISPEQAVSSKQVDHRSDIYSLGCTFFFLLTGISPFTGPNYATVGAKLAGHARDIAPNVRNFRSDVPVSLAKVLSKMLEKLPEKRFQSAFDVGEAIIKTSKSPKFSLFSKKR